MVKITKKLTQQRKTRVHQVCLTHFIMTSIGCRHQYQNWNDYRTILNRFQSSISRQQIRAVAPQWFCRIQNQSIYDVIFKKMLVALPLYVLYNKLFINFYQNKYLLFIILRRSRNDNNNFGFIYFFHHFIICIVIIVQNAGNKLPVT